MTPGDRVTYRDINLALSYRGTLMAVSGRVAEVRWDRFPLFYAKECIDHIRKV